MVYRWERSNQDEAVRNSFERQGADDNSDAAVKVLKLYEPGVAKVEYERQMTAWNIFNKAGIQGPSIPRPYLFKDIKISEETTNTLNNLYKTHLDKNHAEVLVMDFVPGHDFQHFILAEALRLKGVDHDFSSMDSDQLYYQAEEVFNLDHPSREDDRVAQAKIRLHNMDFIYKFLRNHGAKINPEIIKQFSLGIQTFEKASFTHGDLHERNIMFTGSADQFLDAQMQRAVRWYFWTLVSKMKETNRYCLTRIGWSLVS